MGTIIILLILGVIIIVLAQWIVPFFIGLQMDINGASLKTKEQKEKENEKQNEG